MQTFLPYGTFLASAICLDYRRLGKQRVECKQIYSALTDPAYGWQNHPAVTMWRGYEAALARYGVYICKEWRKRGYSDTLLPWFEDRSLAGATIDYPKWLGTLAFHHSHQSNLLRKDPTWYGKFNWDVPADLPYVWPTN